MSVKKTNTVKAKTASKQSSSTTQGTLRICKNSHQYYKSSDCPVCPICENNKKPTEGFLVTLAAPAQRALANAGIQTVTQLSKFTEKEILELHGMGKASLPKLREALQAVGKRFRST